MNISIRLCTEADLSALLKIGIETYRDTFSSMNEPETMNAYLAEAFTATKFASEMACPGTRFYFLEVEGKLAGYLKLNFDSAQSDIRDPQALEIERIYVRKEYQGLDLGQTLIQFSIDQTVAEGKKFVWLGLWEKNVKARAFYERHGFKIAGTHGFRIGNKLQTDFIMRRML